MIFQCRRSERKTYSYSSKYAFFIHTLELILCYFGIHFTKKKERKRKDKDNCKNMQRREHQPVIEREKERIESKILLKKMY